MIVAATNNKGKLKELKELFSDIKSLKELNCDVDVVEDQNTFEGNAMKKAMEISKLLNMPCIADDSGLCIEKFNNWPGVYTARLLGHETSDILRNEHILKRMKNLKDDDRKATVVCVLVYCYLDKVIVGTGILKGKISHNRRGTNGFGFDEIFEVSDGRTLAQLSTERKNKISARYLAMLDLKEKLTIIL